MRPATTLTRSLLAATCFAGLALLAGCGTPESASEPTDVASSEAPAPTGSETADAADESQPEQEPLDFSALAEREKPSRLLHFYAEALHRRNWSAAALAWESGAGVSAEVLEAAYGRETAPTLALGKGTSEGAAGSLFYEAPAVLDYGDGSDVVRGTIILRRANDVPGAGEEQLSWRIRSSTVGPEK